LQGVEPERLGHVGVDDLQHHAIAGAEQPPEAHGGHSGQAVLHQLPGGAVVAALTHQHSVGRGGFPPVVVGKALHHAAAPALHGGAFQGVVVPGPVQAVVRGKHVASFHLGHQQAADGPDGTHLAVVAVVHAGRLGHGGGRPGGAAVGAAYDVRGPVGEPRDVEGAVGLAHRGAVALHVAEAHRLEAAAVVGAAQQEAVAAHADGQVQRAADRGQVVYGEVVVAGGQAGPAGALVGALQHGIGEGGVQRAVVRHHLAHAHVGHRVRGLAVIGQVQAHGAVGGAYPEVVAVQVHLAMVAAHHVMVEAAHGLPGEAGIGAAAQALVRGDVDHIVDLVSEADDVGRAAHGGPALAVVRAAPDGHAAGIVGGGHDGPGRRGVAGHGAAGVGGQGLPGVAGIAAAVRGAAHVGPDMAAGVVQAHGAAVDVEAVPALAFIIGIAQEGGAAHDHALPHHHAVLRRV